MRRLATLTLLCFLLSASAASAAGAGSTLLVSRPDGTDPAPPALDNDATTPGAVSADGRYAVFASDADGLDQAADPRVRNLYLRDRQAQTTTLISRSDGTDGAGMNRDAANPAIAVHGSERPCGRRVRVGRYQRHRPRHRRRSSSTLTTRPRSTSAT